MTFEQAVEKLVSVIRSGRPTWINIKTYDLYAFREVVEQAVAEVGVEAHYIDEEKAIGLFNMWSTGAGAVQGGELIDILRPLAEESVFVLPYVDPKFVLPFVVNFYLTASENKFFITYDLDVPASVKENVLEIEVPYLVEGFAPSTIWDQLLAVYGDEKQLREHFLEKHGIKVMQPLEPWRLGGWDIFKKDMELFAAYKKKEPELDTEILLKGIMLIGIPGTGKSLAAKIVGSYFNWPVIRFSFSSILSQWVGESEKLMDQFMHVVEAIAPVVIYIDEIEKVFHSSQGDPVTPRIIGTILSWMQDTPKNVYMVATANAVFGSHFTAPLPPELMRKGRFDELYFADVPPFEEKLEILKVFFKHYKIPADPEAIDKDKFKKLTYQFTGAELEEAVKRAYIKFAVEGGDYFEHLYATLKEVIPIAKTHSNYIYQLRKFAIGKFKPVSSHQETQMFSVMDPKEKISIRTKEPEVKND